MYVKTSVKYRFCDTCVSGFLEKKTPKIWCPKRPN